MQVGTLTHATTREILQGGHPSQTSVDGGLGVQVEQTPGMFY